MFGATQLALLGCRGASSSRQGAHRAATTLVSDPGGLLDIPPGFRAIELQRAGDPLHDGHRVGAQPDGMACLLGDDGTWVLLRNHELGDADQLRAVGGSPWVLAPPASHAFHPARAGGVSRVVLDPRRLAEALAGSGAPQAAILTSNAVLVGTDRNCAGGVVVTPTTRGWVTCEESLLDGHGWAFFTAVDDDRLVPAASRCLRPWGRFLREGIAQDPRRGLVWMTEDHGHGLFYRFTPRDPKQPFGDGELWALAIAGLAHTDPHAEGDPNASPWAVGTTWPVTWVKIPDPAATTTPCREQGAALGATQFNRCEGITFDAANERVYFIASTAGPLQAGQIFAYDPARDTLTLVTQVEDRAVLSMPDNVTVAPWGDLVVAEDNYDRGASHQYVRGIRPDGSVYDLLRNRRNDPDGPSTGSPGAEFAGCCFSPDGAVLFVNVQGPENVTLAITGDWTTLA